MAMAQRSTLVGVVLAIAVFGAVQETSALKDMKCKGEAITMTDVQINNIKGCAETLGVTSPEKMSPDKIGCFTKCLMEKKELVDADGKPHKENIEKLVDSTMPEKARAEMKEKSGKCIDEHGGKLDAKEPSCKSYIPLAMCSHKVMMEVCM